MTVNEAIIALQKLQLAGHGHLALRIDVQTWPDEHPEALEVRAFELDGTDHSRRVPGRFVKAVE